MPHTEVDLATKQGPRQPGVLDHRTGDRMYVDRMRLPVPDRRRTELIGVGDPKLSPAECQRRLKMAPLASGEKGPLCGWFQSVSTVARMRPRAWFLSR